MNVSRLYRAHPKNAVPRVRSDPVPLDKATYTGAWPLRDTVRNGKRIWHGILATISLAAKGRLVRIPMKLVADEYAFSYASDGWHYFRALLAEYEQNPGIALEQTTFYRFFQDERVRSVCYLDDVLFLHDPARQSPAGEFKFYFGTYPWGDWGKHDSVFGGMPWGHHYDQLEGQSTRDLFGYRRNPWYRPGDRFPLDIEWNQSIRLYHSLKSGYSPLWHGTFPSVILLLRRNGEMRAVRRDGNHRLATLSHLGRESVTVWIAPDSVEAVREVDVDRWYYVRRGMCSRERALEIFNAYFELSGRERLDFLGLPRGYGR